MSENRFEREFFLFRNRMQRYKKNMICANKSRRKMGNLQINLHNSKKSRTFALKLCEL